MARPSLALGTLRYSDLLRVWESSRGCSDGWDLEIGGRIVALMDEPRFEDMFWVSYRLTPTTDDPALAARLLTEAFWKDGRWSDITFRSRATGLVAEHAVPAGRPFAGPARVNMRALYVPVREPAPWDRAVLAVRRILRPLGGAN